MMQPVYHPLPGRLWVVRLADLLAGRLKNYVEKWPSIDKENLGDQITRSMDSISANLSEGYVRMHAKERLYFFSMARGSLEETLRHLRRLWCRRINPLRLHAITGMPLKPAFSRLCLPLAAAVVPAASRARQARAFRSIARQARRRALIRSPAPRRRGRRARIRSSPAFARPERTTWGR